ncbi:MAG: NADH-quinone oxidoreductase subunit D [Paludibacteraceae bacterium]|jgi:NADH-quinone oxidoreductase subunit C/D|nr:NADH-quinone oxidoreductase subunit D [Paludibacteraceae bacterium]MBO5988263.1 NADH-quinone oxidoreductase subunit D [Paludibacteraceae bacterium]
MEKIKKLILSIVPDAVAEEAQYPTFTVDASKIRSVAEKLKEKGFDYLICLTGMDYGDSLGCIYHISSSTDKTSVIVLKTSTSDRQNPAIPSVHDIWASANLYEREVYDFFGITFIDHPDMRRLFLRQDWNGYPFRKDYDANPELNPVPMENQTIAEMENMPSITLKSDGTVIKKENALFEKGDYVVNIGPQHPATHGVLHLRVSLDGEIIKKVDPNFGYIHRGIEKMCESMTYPQMLHLTDRLDYLSGTMNRHAMCLCVEKAMGLEVPQRAQYVRCIFDELTRIASHLLGWGCMCMDMGSITAFIYGMRDREKIMDIFEETGGGRLMVNYSVIGGLAEDVHPNFVNRVKEFIPYMRKMIKEYHILFTGNPIAKGRMKDIGFLSKETAVSLGVTGPSGRASGFACDVRKIEPYAAYDKVQFEEVIREKGGTFDRYIIRLDEIEQSLRIIEQLIDKLPDDGFRAKVPAIIKLPAGEYYQRVENARGDFGVYIKSDGGKNPYRVKFRSPCMTLISALDPLCQKEKIADLIMIGASLDYVIPCADR